MKEIIEDETTITMILRYLLQQVEKELQPGDKETWEAHRDRKDDNLYYIHRYRKGQKLEEGTTITRAQFPEGIKHTDYLGYLAWRLTQLLAAARSDLIVISPDGLGVLVIEKQLPT